MNKQRIIWLAIASSTILYAVAAYLVVGESETSLGNLLKQPIVIASYAAGVMMLFAAPVIAGSVGRKNRDAGLVVMLALYESIAIFGLLAAFLVHDWRVYPPAWAIAAIGFLRSYPSNESAQS